MFAKLVPYSSVVGNGITLHETPEGPCIAMLALHSVRAADGETGKETAVRIAAEISNAVNGGGIRSVTPNEMRKANNMAPLPAADYEHGKLYVYDATSQTFK